MAQCYKLLHGNSAYVEQNSDTDREYHWFCVRLYAPQYDEVGRKMLLTIV